LRAAQFYAESAPAAGFSARPIPQIADPRSRGFVTNVYLSVTNM
jgi:hypothetical protein